MSRIYIAATVIASVARVPDGQISVSGASIQVVPAYPGRARLEIYNDDASDLIYAALGVTARPGAGERINPNGGRWATPDDTGGVIYDGAVYLISTGVNTNVCFVDI